MYDTRFIAPKKRSVARVMAGRFVYTALRWLQWLRYGEQYATRPKATGRAADFSCLVATHATPLERKLAGADPLLQANKAHNLRLAIARLDGLVLAPGKKFSYWKLIGAPSASRGFRKGMVIVNGKVDAYIGGGLCQLSNLLYWMTLHTPLTVTERYRHSYDVFPDADRTQPFGSGATCVYNYRDLQLHNREVEAFQLRLRVENGYLIGEWRCQRPPEQRYEVYEARHWITQAGPGLYIRNNELRRRIYPACGPDAGKAVADEPVAENHALMMYSPLLAPPTGFSGEGGPS